MSLEKLLAGNAAFKKLSQEDQDALAEIPKGSQRLELYALWNPTDEELAEVASGPLNVLISAVHLLLPLAVAHNSFGDDSGRVYFTYQDKVTDEIAGFDRQGNRNVDGAFDPLNEATLVVHALTKETTDE